MKSLYLISVITMFSSIAQANECEVTVTSNDAMQFDTSAIEVPASCSEFEVTLQHSGRLPKMAMGHNWVLTTSSDAQPVATDGIAAGPSNHYIKPNDSRVIAFTPLIGGGEVTSVTIDVSKLNSTENYTFFCSFPGHIGIMKGDFSIKE